MNSKLWQDKLWRGIRGKGISSWLSSCVIRCACRVSFLLFLCIVCFGLVVCDQTWSAEQTASVIVDTVQSGAARILTDTTLATSTASDTSYTASAATLDTLAVTPKELSNNQKYLIEACENYTSLFPKGERTPQILELEAQVYFDTQDYPKAISSYENIVNDFPKSPQYANAFHRIIESYNKMENFYKVELWAERLRETGISPEETKLGRDEAVRSMLERANRWLKKGQYAKAAKEYERMAIKEPDHRDAPASLFNAAVQYYKGGQLEKAITVYQQVAITYPTTARADTALNSAAVISMEIKKWGQAAEIYEQLLSTYPRTGYRELALSNLSTIYTDNLKNFESAARVNESYV